MAKLGHVIFAGARAWPSGGLLVLFVASATACATGSRAHGDAPAAVATTASTVVVPSGPGATFYRSHVQALPPTDPFVVQIKAALDRFMKTHGRPALAEDARLDQLASDLARLSADRQVSVSGAMEFLRSHYGVVEPEPNLIGMGGDHGAEDAALANLAGQLAGIPIASTWRQVGIGVWRVGATWSASLVLQENNITVEALPRILPSRGHTTIAGRVRPGFQSPEVVVTPPQGAVVRLPVQGLGGNFSARLECNAGDGSYQVEVNAEDRRGPTVLANFPLYCGVMPPATLELAAVPTAAGGRDPMAIERQILDLMDRDRAAAGLPRLQRDPRLAEVARAYSREMAESGEIAHLSPRTGSVVDRVRRAGISPAPTVIAENVGRDYTADGIEHGFMASPGHRDNLLSRAVTHVGVGVALGQPEGDTVPIFVTQVFVGWGQ